MGYGLWVWLRMRWYAWATNRFFLFCFFRLTGPFVDERVAEGLAPAAGGGLASMVVPNAITFLGSFFGLGPVDMCVCLLYVKACVLTNHLRARVC